MASVREFRTHSSRLYKLCHLSTYPHNVQRFIGAKSSLSYENKDFSTQEASQSRFTPVVCDRKFPTWQTAEEKLQILEKNIERLVAKSKQMIGSIDKEKLSLDYLSSLTMWLSLITTDKNVSRRELRTIPVKNKQLIIEEEVKVHKPLQDVTSSVEVKRVALFQLKERNGKLAQKMKELEAEIEALKEKQILEEKQLDHILGTRLGMKRNNIKLRKKNTKMLKEQRKLTGEQIQMMKELDVQERELTAALKTNQNLRCVAKRLEGMSARLRRWAHRMLVPLRRIFQ